MTRAASNLKQGSTPPVSSVLIGSGAGKRSVERVGVLGVVRLRHGGT